MNSKTKKALKVTGVIVVIFLLVATASILEVDAPDTDIHYVNNWYYEVEVQENQSNLIQMSDEMFKLLVNETSNTMSLTFDFKRVGVFNQVDKFYYPIMLMDTGVYTGNNNISYDVVSKTPTGEFDVQFVELNNTHTDLKSRPHSITEQNYSITMNIKINENMIENMELYDGQILRLFVSLPESPKYCRSEPPIPPCSNSVNYYIDITRWTDE